jgi:hypothetical protein
MSKESQNALLGTTKIRSSQLADRRRVRGTKPIGLNNPLLDRSKLLCNRLCLPYLTQLSQRGSKYSTTSHQLLKYCSRSRQAINSKLKSTSVSMQAPMPTPKLSCKCKREITFLRMRNLKCTGRVSKTMGRLSISRLWQGQLANPL